MTAIEAISRTSSSSSSSSELKTLPLNPVRSRLGKTEKDNMLSVLAQQTLDAETKETIWIKKEDQVAARVIAKKIKTLYNRKQKIAFISGLLAAIGSGCGCIPTVGGIVGAPFCYAANYYGADAGIKLGFSFAEQCDLRQDLYGDSKSLYTSLAFRLLDRFIKTLRVDMAQQMEAPYGSDLKLIPAEKKARWMVKKAQLKNLSEHILARLPLLEKQAVETLCCRKLRNRTPEEEKQVVDKVPKKQRRVNKIKKEILTITAPLKEVCEYIQGSTSGFSDPILHNERNTMILFYKDLLKDKLMIVLSRRHAAEMGALKQENDTLKTNLLKLLERMEQLETRLALPNPQKI